ncbi:glycosyltransferase family 2 protein [Marinicauda algicola]|uniref:Glycosyltransferase family 2 protein n=1 Tax=Marinicauda algicola TaxID=2029849 RepID=A0A4S2H4G1_9PROT|nr:glycosyltransferase family 2 protein [Marinicauda algicola]TGY90291.1 glycosyltransferase family 2 protein [Marinicauda algicola]
MAEPDVRLSVLIVCYRSRETIGRVSSALAAQTVRRAEILVLENGSPDGERVSADQLPEGARLIESETNLGFAPGNNRLARESTGDWLVLLNPDAFPEPDWLEQMLAATTRWPDAAMFGCTQRAYGAPGVLDGAGDVYHASGLPYRAGYGREMEPPPEGETFAACGAAMLIRRDLFEDLGGFDEDYFCYVEDVDLAFRARLLGHRAVQVRDAVVEHIGYGSSGRRSEFAAYHGARNRLWTFFKNMPWPLLILLAPVHLLATFALWLSAIRHGQFMLFGRAMRDGFAAWPRLMEKRREIQARRRTGMLAVARMMAWNPLRLFTRSPHIRHPR